MADNRPKDITTEATQPAADDYFVIDGSTNGSRKIKIDGLRAGMAEATASDKGLMSAGDKQTFDAVKNNLNGSNEFTFAGIERYAMRDVQLFGGGTFTFNSSTGNMAWSATIFLTNGRGGFCTIAAGNVTLASLQSAYVTMDDDKVGSDGAKTTSIDVWNTTTVLGSKNIYSIFSRYSNTYYGILWSAYIKQETLANKTNIATNAADIATNAADIATNVDDITTNKAGNARIDKVIPDSIKPLLTIISQGAYTVAGEESVSATRCRSQKITATAKTYSISITGDYYYYIFKSTNGLFDDLTTYQDWTTGISNVSLPEHFLFIFKKGSAGTDPVTPDEIDFQVGGIDLSLYINNLISGFRFAGRIGATGHVGRTAYPFDNSTPKTFRKVFTIAQHCDYVRVGFINGGTNQFNIAKAAVASLDTTTNFAATGLTFTNLTFDSNESGIVPAAAGTGRRGYLISDWVALSSLVPSDDSSAEPKIIVSAYVDTAGTLTLMGKSDGSTDFTNWASHPTRPMVMRYNNGDCVTTPANFTSTTNRSTSPIGFIQYVSRGQVVTVFAVGDSIANGEGSGITYAGQTEAFLACVELSDLDGVAYDFVNLAWSGTTTDHISEQVIDILEAKVLPDIMMIPIGSPNDISTTIADSHIQNARQRYTRSILECEKRGVIPVIWTWLATDTSIKAYGSTDSLRRDYNDAVRTLANKGVIVADYASVIDGVADGSGQIQMVPAYTSDHIHPNDTGKAALKPLAKNAILACGVAKTGSLITE